MTKWLIIELYSDMGTNNVVDCRLAGDLIKLPAISAIKLIDFMMEEHVEFSVWELGECLVDKSYKYWE